MVVVQCYFNLATITILWCVYNFNVNNTSVAFTCSLNLCDRVRFIQLVCVCCSRKSLYVAMQEPLLKQLFLVEAVVVSLVTHRFKPF